MRAEEAVKGLAELRRRDPEGLGELAHARRSLDVIAGIEILVQP